MLPARPLTTVALGAVFLALSLPGCGEDDEDEGPITGPTELRADCTGCHTDRASIEATAAPVEEVEEDPGEG